MENDEKVQILQLTYAGVLADAVLQMGREGVLGKVTEQKRREQMLTGKTKAAQFGITQPEEVFLKLSEVFNCANWEITAELNDNLDFTVRETLWDGQKCKVKVHKGN
jgi:hypothetical protein